MPAAHSVGQEVKRLRNLQGLSQRELARRAALSPAYISEVERGLKAPTLTALRQLASGLNVTTEALLVTAPVDPLPEPSAPDSTNAADSTARATEGGLSWGDRLRLVRSARGKSLAETAQRAGISVGYLADIERGRVKPSLEALRKLAVALEFSVAALYHSGDVVLAAKLRQLRSDLGLSQDQLARRVGVSPSLVGQLEQGRALPSLDTLERLADALGVSPCYLIIEEPRLEDMLAAMHPDVRRMLGDPGVQAFLRMICDMPENELRFVMRMVQLYKEHRDK